MKQIVFNQRAITINISDSIKLRVYKDQGRYFLTVSDFDSLKVTVSKPYNSMRGINNLLKKYGVELVKKGEF